MKYVHIQREKYNEPSCTPSPTSSLRVPGVEAGRAGLPRGCPIWAFLKDFFLSISCAAPNFQENGEEASSSNRWHPLT